jgi:5S rRNA maturation endonuclease (ribonuclease M5)
VTAQDFAELLSHVKRSGANFSARCPAHDDQHESLSFADGDKGVVLTCHAGCRVEAICGALGIPVAGLFTTSNGHAPSRPKIVATYNYEDEAGRLLYQAVRYDPKDFRQRRPTTTGAWSWTLADTRRVVYRLAKLQGQAEVVIVEGEKDVDRLWGLGLAATTNAMGAGKWQDAYSEQLLRAGIARFIIIPDNDRAGQAHAAEVVRSLQAFIPGGDIRRVHLPGLPPVRDKHGEDISDWLDAGHTFEELRDLIAQTPRLRLEQAPLEKPAAPLASEYLETLADFIAEDDPPTLWIFPELLPSGVIMLIHGEPRARKSLAAVEIALAAATGTAPFGLARFTPVGPVPVLYVQEEDTRALTRPRLRALTQTRGGAPTTLVVSVRRGINLDDPVWIDRLTADVQRLDAKLLVLDAARRLSAKTDEGPAKVRELIAALRSIVTATGVAIAIVHHDVKPPQNGQDQRRRSQRASGGDWFAASECPVHVERVGARESLVYPEDYKYTTDPAPFTFTCEIAGGLVTRLVGADTTTETAERAGIRGKVLDWLRMNGPASKTAMQKAGIARWEILAPVLEALGKEGKVDAGPGRQNGSLRYFVTSPPGSSVGLNADEGSAAL